MPVIDLAAETDHDPSISTSHFLISIDSWTGEQDETVLASELSALLHFLRWGLQFSVLRNHQ